MRSVWIALVILISYQVLCLVDGGVIEGSQGRLKRAGVKAHEIWQKSRDLIMTPRPALRSSSRMGLGMINSRRMLGIFFNDSEECRDLKIIDEIYLKPIREKKEARTLMKGLNSETSISILIKLGFNRSLAFIHGYPSILQDRSFQQYSNKTENYMQVAIVHPSTAKLLRRYNLADQHLPHHFSYLIKQIQPSRIIVILASISTMTDRIKHTMNLVGSNGTDALGSGGKFTWAWIGVNGTTRYNEIVTDSRNNQPILQEVVVPRQPVSKWCDIKNHYKTKSILHNRVTSHDTKRLRNEKIHHNDKSNANRKGTRKTIAEHQLKSHQELCTNYDGYGSLCSCPPPQQYNFSDHEDSIPPRSTSVPPNTVIIILAIRPVSLHRLLENLLQKHNVPPGEVLVYTQNVPTEEIKLVCGIHNVSVEPVLHGSECLRLHITRLYEGALKASYVLRDDAQFFITLEDDMIVHPGFFKWMAKGFKEIQNTDDYICVNSQPKQEMEDPFTSMATGHEEMIQSFKGFRINAGWGVPRNVLKVMLKEWMMMRSDVDWLLWVLQLGGHGACIHPEISYITHVKATKHNHAEEVPPLYYS